MGRDRALNETMRGFHMQAQPRSAVTAEAHTARLPSFSQFFF